MKKQWKHYKPAEEVAILRRHLLEKELISKLCDELGLQPTVFQWQKEFFENGAPAFEQMKATNRSAGRERIAYLESKIPTKDSGAEWCSVVGLRLERQVTRPCRFNSEEILIQRWQVDPLREGRIARLPLSDLSEGTVSFAP